MSTSPAQLRYLTDAVSTATPARLVVMLYDRLGLDLRRATEAHAVDDRYTASGHLLHAQQIIAELMSSLRLELWPDGKNLASLYSFILGELIAVNGKPDLARLAKVSEIVSGLRESWSQAGAALQTGTAPVATIGTDSPPMAWVG